MLYEGQGRQDKYREGKRDNFNSIINKVLINKIK
jgi:hypothetical protein